MAMMPASVGVTHPEIIPQMITIGASSARNVFFVVRHKRPRSNGVGAGAWTQPKRTIARISSISAPPITMPGPIPAMNSRPIDTLAVIAYTTIMMLGGMIGPSVDTAITSAAENGLG